MKKYILKEQIGYFFIELGSIIWTAICLFSVILEVKYGLGI